MRKNKLLLMASLLLSMMACQDETLDQSATQTPAELKSELRSSNYRPERRAPLYWSPYSFIIDQDRPHIGLNDWEANIKWVETNLKPYGYKMICIDGWGNVDFNEHGYRTKHHKDWGTKDYAYWSKHLQDKGMELGIYDNPLWINTAAASAGKKIAGTNIPIESILNRYDRSTHPVMNGGAFYWVQVDKPGAEEYVKGYIAHYANMGVRFLRVDFLSWYETGKDKEKVVVGRTDRPREHYETALRWMREECDKHGVFLSLVMPDLRYEGELEAKYGDMIRIGEDTGKGGGWKRFSQAQRRIKRNWWSRYANPMDGFAYFSQISGRGKVILDGDFTPIHSYGSDNEKKLVITQHVIAGGPIAVTDTYQTIGNNLTYFTNTEVLALNKDGFVGKPLSYDPNSNDCQVWTGQMSNGDWVVALFNREDTKQKRGLNLEILGIRSEFVARDLWKQEAVTINNGMYYVELEGRSCRLLRITPTGAVRPNALPAPWLRSDVGNAKENGTALYDVATRTFTVKSKSLDIEGTYDEFNFIHQPIDNDVEIIARVTNVSNTHEWAKAGIMIRSAQREAWANNAMIAITPVNRVTFQHRTYNTLGTANQGVSNVTADVWLKLRRRGNNFLAFHSKDKLDWKQIGGSITIIMPQTTYVGLAVTSHNQNVEATAVFKDVTVTKLPDLGWTDRDIGYTGQPGIYEYSDEKKEYRIGASGNDIEGSEDGFHYVYKHRSGNFTCITQVTSLDITNPWAKAGIMIREGESAKAINAFVGITAANGLTFQQRTNFNGPTSATLKAHKLEPVWLKLERAGDSFKAYHSKDKVNWAQIGDPKNIKLPNNVLVGMAVTSHDNGKRTYATYKDITIN